MDFTLAGALGCEIIGDEYGFVCAGLLTSEFCHVGWISFGLRLKMMLGSLLGSARIESLDFSRFLRI
jgi:hypothetical protein